MTFRFLMKKNAVGSVRFGGENNNMLLPLPKSQDEIVQTQRERKRAVFLQAQRSSFYAGKLDHIRADRLDDPEEWRKIPILTKDELREISDQAFYSDFCLTPTDGIAEYWRSGGATGRPLFYPRSFRDIRYAILSFRRALECIGCSPGAHAHLSFPLGIHPAGQIYGRAAADYGISVTWAGAGTTTPSSLQISLIESLKPELWLGMSSYALQLANMAAAKGLNLPQGSIKTIICSAEPLSQSKRAKIAQSWGARVFDTFGMTEAGMIGAEDGRMHKDAGNGFRIWSDMYYCEVVDPDTYAPLPPGETGCLVVTPLWTSNVTPFLRWNSGDMVAMTASEDESGPFSVFPFIRHAHRTAGFFKIRGVNINHAEFEDFMFALPEINDFKCEVVAPDGMDTLLVAVECQRGADLTAITGGLAARIKEMFEITPSIIVRDPGSLAQEFEANIKAPRFADSRQKG